MEKNSRSSPPAIQARLKLHQRSRTSKKQLRSVLRGIYERFIVVYNQSGTEKLKGVLMSFIVFNASLRLYECSPSMEN